MQPTQYLSPKQVAEAVGVSESSLKRWCDRGLLRTHRTGGGHRRLALGEVLEFLRANGHAIQTPELLGLPKGAQASQESLPDLAERLWNDLIEGQENAVRRTLLNAFLAPHSIVELGDLVIAPTFVRIGSGWEHHEIDVYQERRSVEICVRALNELRRMQPAPPPDAPLAIGGALTADQLPTLLVEMTLREAGWRAESMGAGLPLESFVRAVHDARPRLVWISASHALGGSEEKIAGLNAVFDAISAEGGALVVGGAGFSPELRSRLKYSAFCDNLGHLASFARLLAPVPAKSS